MGDTSARHAMGLFELTQICHKVVPFPLSIWDRSSKPNIGNDTVFEGHANVKERKENVVFIAERSEDLEVLDEKKEETQEHSHRYRQRISEAYGRTIKERMFTEGQLILRIADHVKRGMVGPSKFSSKWEGPSMVREAHANRYYFLAQMDGKDLVDPINGKWLKRYYA